MSARPIERKQRRKAIRSLRRSLPRYFDLVQWLIDHGHARTRREACEVILAERVKAASHTLGILRAQAVRDKHGAVKIEDVVQRYVPVEHKHNVIVSAA